MCHADYGRTVACYCADGPWRADYNYLDSSCSAGDSLDQQVAVHQWRGKDY